MFTVLVDVFTKFLVLQIYTPFFPNIWVYMEKKKKKAKVNMKKKKK